MQKKGFCWLVKIYLLVLLGSALLAPLFYTIVLQLDAFVQVDWLHYLAKKPLCQFIDRLRIVGFVCIIPLLLKVAHIKWKDLDLTFNGKTYLYCFFQGCFLWLCLFMCIVLVTQTFHVRDYGHLSILKLFVSSLVLAFVEELIFRGFIFAFLRRNYSIQQTTNILAFLFAILHFSLCRDNKMQDIPLLLNSLQCAWHSIADIWINIHGSYFFSLFLLSKILVLLRFYYGSLWATIGFHQGLVFTLMGIRQIFYFNENQNTFWGTGRLTDAWFVVIVLVLMYLYLRFCLRKKYKHVL